VQQDVFIFAGTIRENLTLLGDSITEEKLNAACDATGMNQILARLEAGLETRLDERGSNLSLGERQVLAITRVLLQDPDILILDEATSHVDNSTERLLQKAIEQVTKNRTSILIAHRLSTIRDADRIFVFEKGAIVESGTHDELVTAQGAYYSFSKLQTL
jgi:ATP-binding cassette subfamily B protein